jgi:hypothetical protein
LAVLTLQGDLRSNDFLQVSRYKAALHGKPAAGRAFIFLQICRYALDNSGVSSSWAVGSIPVRSKMSRSAATVLPSTPSSAGKGTLRQAPSAGFCATRFFNIQLSKNGVEPLPGQRFASNLLIAKIKTIGNTGGSGNSSTKLASP